MANVDLKRVPKFYHNYISQVKEADLARAFQNHQTDFVSFLTNIPEDKWNYRYTEGKWSIKELVQHVIDAERIFCYRALRFSRKDKTELPGFEENDYAPASRADRRTKADLLEELKTVQKSSAQLFASFDEEQLNESGSANGSSVYVKAIGFIIVGHALHHKNVLSEKYLQEKTIQI
jgi:uncharacterized damage-inducible protein DinB